jgi:hypothetical protein
MTRFELAVALGILSTFSLSVPRTTQAQTGMTLSPEAARAAAAKRFQQHAQAALQKLPSEAQIKAKQPEGAARSLLLESRRLIADAASASNWTPEKSESFNTVGEALMAGLETGYSSRQAQGGHSALASTGCTTRCSEESTACYRRCAEDRSNPYCHSDCLTDEILCRAACIPDGLLGGLMRVFGRSTE